MRTNSVITVFEHDKLTRESYPALNERHLKALLRLNEFHNFDYFEPIHNGIRLKQYVGIIQVDRLTIEILPKTDKNTNANNWRRLLLSMLKACGRIKAYSSGFASVKKQNLNLLDVYFDLFLSEVEGLLRRGLVKKYRKKTGNLNVMKGKLEFSGNIRENTIHKERFYTSHQVYDHDHLLNQVISYALSVVEVFSGGSYLFDRCKRALFWFPETSNVRLNRKKLDSIVLNRKTKPYADALSLARLIILNYSPDISVGREKMISLLFDMNKLWEEFVFIETKKALFEEEFVVRGQDSRPFISHNFLKPDITITHKSDPSRVYVIDTKWKQPKGRSAAVSDLRQMYAYGRFWNAKKTILLYPGESSSGEFDNYKTEDYYLADGEFSKIIHSCRSGYVSVVDENGVLSKQVGKKVLKLLEEGF